MIVSQRPPKPEEKVNEAAGVEGEECREKSELANGKTGYCARDETRAYA